jgi:hypothetical protein
MLPHVRVNPLWRRNGDGPWLLATPGDEDDCGEVWELASEATVEETPQHVGVPFTFTANVGKLDVAVLMAAAAAAAGLGEEAAAAEAMVWRASKQILALTFWSSRRLKVRDFTCTSNVRCRIHEELKRTMPLVIPLGDGRRRFRAPGATEPLHCHARRGSRAVPPSVPRLAVLGAHTGPSSCHLPRLQAPGTPTQRQIRASVAIQWNKCRNCVFHPITDQMHGEGENGGLQSSKPH